MKDLHLLPFGVSADRRSKASLYRQIYDGLRSAILDGRLESGVRLPSTRAAAAELGVSRNTMVAVFEQLAAEGFLRSRVGDGTRVADIGPELLFRPTRRNARRSGSARKPAIGSAPVSPSPSALRVGYVIAPEGLEAAFAHAVRNTGQTVPQPMQGALAEFVEEGHYGRHVRRMRTLYAKRQALLFALVGEHLPGVLELLPCESGMQVAGFFVENLDDRAVAAAGARVGLALAPLSGYWMGPGGRAGLHLGYAGIPEEVLEEAVRRLAKVLRRA